MKDSESSSFGKPQTGGIAADRLKSFIERVERLEVDKAQVQEYIKDVFSEAKASGFDPKIMRQIIRMRKQDADKLAEEEAILDLYKRALGMEI